MEHKFVPPSRPSHPFIDQSMRRCWRQVGGKKMREESLQGGPVGKGTCHQARGPEFNPRTHKVEGENRLVQGVFGKVSSDLHVCTVQGPFP